MAHFIRGKQAGVQKDFSSAVSEEFFVLDDLRRFGVSSRITEVSYDPVQSLLAVGTASSSFGPGQVYIYGRGRISAVFRLPTVKATVRTLRFCSDRLICLDDKNDISIFSLAEKKLITSYAPPATVSCIECDPTLDFAMIGMQNGDILAYDVDRQSIAPFRLPCFWSEVDRRVKAIPVVSLQFHPRDIGTLLIAYTEGACIYSFKQNKVLKHFHYKLNRGAPGGDGDPATINLERTPNILHAVWHPTGTFVLTAHEDSSLVFWDSQDGRMVMARSLFDTNVDRPVSVAALDDGSYAPRTPFTKIAWCANKDPDDTGILVAGGSNALLPARGMTFMEMGRTPNYVTSSWQVLSQHFEKPKRERMLPTPAGVEVVNFCLIPRSTPWYAGTHDPIAILAVLSSGELTTLSFPSGYPISPTNQLHVSLSLVHPFVTKLEQVSVDRGRWLGLTENRSSGPKILQGGAEASYPLKRFESRNIVTTAHADGSIRLWDAGHADEIENELAIQADVGGVLGRSDNLLISAVSFSGASSELAVGMETGELIIFRWSRNQHPDQAPRQGAHNEPHVLTNVSARKDPSLLEGLHPFTVFNAANGPVTAVKMSDVGFVAAGFAGGSVVVIDLRGPAIIFNDNLADLLRKEHRSSLRRKRDSTNSTSATAFEFSVMQAEHDSYSSILLHAGTSNGAVATFKLLPAATGGYSVEYVGFTQCEGSIVSINPINAQTGKPALATQNAVGGLSSGIIVDGVVLAVSKLEARLFKPATARGASKTWDGGLCEAAAVTQCLDLGRALVCLFSDGTARAYSIPGLAQLGKIKIGHIVNVGKLSDAVVTENGGIIAWTGPSEIAHLNVWGTGEVQTSSEDRLFNPEALIPARPTISGFQWVSGTQFMTSNDLNLLIGGPNRPLSKRQIQQAQADEVARRQAARAQAQAGSSQGPVPIPGTQPEGYLAYVQRQITERTEKLNLVGDSVERLEDSSRGWVEDVNSFVSRQKRNMVMGVVKNKFGL